MNILIIGSRGFIGSHCADYFRSQAGYEVWECDVIIDYDKPRYMFVEAVDSDFSEVFEGKDFDVCINCSGAANVPFSLERPLNDFQLNTLNVFKILDAIRRISPECKFINLSSAAVYGNPVSLPIDERQPVAPVSPYGEHKAMAERICSEFARFWDVRTCSVRIFSAYGPGLRKQLLWDIYKKTVQTETDTVELFGTGRETRDFIYISDLTRLLHALIKSAPFHGEVINAASGRQTSVDTIARLLLAALGCEKQVVYRGTNRKGDPLNWEADISMARSFGFLPRTTIEKGIKQVAQWMLTQNS